MPVILSLFKSKDIHSLLDRPLDAQAGIIGASIAVVSLCTAVAAYSLIGSRASDGIPCVPYTWPWIGSRKEYRKDPQAFVDRWTVKLGPVYRVYINGRMQTVVSGHHVREVFLNNDFNFIKGFGKSFDVPLLANIPDRNLNPELLRSIITKQLTVKQRQYTPLIVEQLITAAHEKLGDADEPKEVPHLFPLLQHMVGKASATIFFGPELAKNKDLIETCKSLTIDIGTEMGPGNFILDSFPTLARLRMWYLGKFGRAVNKHRKFFFDILKPVVDERLGEKGADWERPHDILQNVIEEDPLFTPDNPDRYNLAVDWTLNLIFASIHTTSDSSTVIMYRILQNPEIIDVLLEEQDEVLKKHYGPNYGDSDATKLFTSNVIKDMVKLDSVCREALRSRNIYYDFCHTYTGKSRTTLSCGAVIEPGDDMLINLWANHRDPNLQRDEIGDYHEFKPFRFVGLDRQTTKIGEDFLLFGQGRHACPGRWFAIQEVKTLVSVLIRYYTIKSEGDIVFPTSNRVFLPTGQAVFQKKKRDV